MDKIDKYLDAIEHPDQYSTAEIETMLQDQAVKEVSDLLDKTKSSLQMIGTPDVEEEWKRFEQKQREAATPLRRRLVWVSFRNAAASIAIAVATFTAVAAVVGDGIHYHSRSRSDQSPTAEITKDAVAQHPDTLKVIEKSKANTPETVVFSDATLEAIITKIAAYHGCKVVFKNEASKSLRLYFRWNKASRLEDVSERLNNFQHIHITVDDNTITVD